MMCEECGLEIDRCPGCGSSQLLKKFTSGDEYIVIVCLGCGGLVHKCKVTTDFEKVRKIIWRFVCGRKEFRFSELLQAILDEVGMVRVAANYTLKEYLETLEFLGYIKEVGSGVYVSNVCRR